MSGSPFEERNRLICDLYMSGKTLQECKNEYGISRERVRQILRKAGVFRGWRAATTEGSDRVEFLGINVSAEMKENLKTESTAQDISLSELVSNTLDKAVGESVTSEPQEKT